jgi:Uma2 family endonuclease
MVRTSWLSGGGTTEYSPRQFFCCQRHPKESRQFIVCSQAASVSAAAWRARICIAARAIALRWFSRNSFFQAASSWTAQFAFRGAPVRDSSAEVCSRTCRVSLPIVLASLKYICSMPLTIQLHPSENQTAFNLERWRQLLADPELARLPYRVETDRHGHILMSPPPAPAHGKKQNRIGTLLEQFLPNGHVVTECPVSTPDGVKAVDVAWLTPKRGQEADTETCLTRAPEICVEILSPSNTAGEIGEKIALYFEAGACEVWICERDGTLKFHFSSPPEIRESSELCPQFPPLISFLSAS